MKNKHIGSSLTDAISENSKSIEFKQHFEKEKAISTIAQLAYDLRLESGLTQRDLAQKAKTTQQTIARLESGKDSRLPSIDLLSRIANGLGKKLTIQFK